jgi:hypothetical protein
MGVMLSGQLALIAAAIFSGAAVYINIAEQPARLGLDDGSLLKEWQPAYKHGLAVQASLAVVGFLLGALAWWQSGDWRWLIGACVLVTNWPYTLLGMMPTNKRLMAMDPARPGAETRALVTKWGGLHGVRTALGFTATAIFLWASVR